MNSAVLAPPTTLPFSRERVKASSLTTIIPANSSIENECKDDLDWKLWLAVCMTLTSIITLDMDRVYLVFVADSTWRWLYGNSSNRL